jgi:hypothetical protein
MGNRSVLRTKSQSQWCSEESSSTRERPEGRATWSLWWHWGIRMSIRSTSQSIFAVQYLGHRCEAPESASETLKIWVWTAMYHATS